MIGVTKIPIVKLRDTPESSHTTTVKLVQAYLTRIDAYDIPGMLTTLSAVVVRNPDTLAEAQASNTHRARGKILGPLDDIPYTTRDSYLVRSFTAASGSPAFEDLMAQRDASTVERLCAAGATCLGKTNMPPTANGGVQRGVYSRAESLYNIAYLAAPSTSGSSNDAGTATVASFAAPGLVEETWSSGRGPASNSGLYAYTPSRGVISVHGNWPLTPIMDVVVPYARSMAGLLEILDIVIVDDPDIRGDLQRTQPWVPIPKASEVRPVSYPTLATGTEALAGKRLDVPRMLINTDPDAGTSESSGIDGPTGQRIHTRPLVIALWEQARKALETASTEVVEVDFPLVSNCEGDRPGTLIVFNRDLVPKEFLHDELWGLSAWGFDGFLHADDDLKLNRPADVDGPQTSPHDPGTLSSHEGDLATGMDECVRTAEHGIESRNRITTPLDGLRGLEKTRRIGLEEWMRRLHLDTMLLSTVADVGLTDVGVNPVSADIAWSNSVRAVNGNPTIRHLGVPTVTVPIGAMTDIGVPVGLTFADRAYDDSALLRSAVAFESAGSRRIMPSHTPSLVSK